MIRKIRNYYRSLQQPVKASFWSLICGFGQKGISMLTIPIFIRVMSDAEYGRYSVYHSWLSIVELIVTLDLAGSVYTRGLIANENYQENCYKIVVHRSDGTSTEYLLVGSRLIDQNTQQEFPVSEDTMKDLKNALGIPLN